jgi:stringent starvation protein B
MSDASTKPYLIRAIHEWCSDNGFTPYLAVAVDQTTQVPREYVRAGEIVLNVSLEATNKLQLGNEYVEFQARFGGQARDIVIPIANVSAIYARENGHGMSFEVAKPLGIVEDGSDLHEGSSPAERAPAGSARGLSSVKPSSAPKHANTGSSEAKRPNARKLKSVNTGDRASQGSEPHSDHRAEQVVSMAPESTSESSKSKIDHLASESGAATESQEPTRTASAPRPVAQPQKKSDMHAERSVEGSGGQASSADSEKGNKNLLLEAPADPTTEPTKPTGGKPKLTRVK